MELAKIALEFCREVMGWEDAYHSGDGYIVSRSRAEVWTPGNSSDLNAVITVVINWADLHNAVVETYCFKDTLAARVRLTQPLGEAAWHLGETLQEALLAACLDANRKLGSGK